MYISEVAKRTKLTKKAIRYYEQEGLIAPYVDTETQYRNYSEEDVGILVQISLLRQMDFSVSEIKKLLEDPADLEVALQAYMQKIDYDIQKMRENRQAIQGYLEGTKSVTMDEFAEYILELRDNIEDLDQTKQDFMKRQLLRMFPGVFGQVIWLRFSPFLRGTLDTSDKQQAWENIVQYLDDVESLEVSDELEAMYGIYTSEELEKMAEANYQNTMRISSASDSVLLEIQQEVSAYVSKLQQSDELQKLRSDMGKVVEPLKNEMSDSGYYEHFINNMRILSPEYDRYHENLAKIQERMGLQYTKDGQIITGNEID